MGKGTRHKGTQQAGATGTVGTCTPGAADGERSGHERLRGEREGE